MAYRGGMPQKDLAVQYGISDRSVKRLIAEARKSGAALRARAVTTPSSAARTDFSPD
jgi:transposase